MKSFLFLLFTLLTSCSSIELIEMWKNPKIDSLSVSKVLIVGMTSNMEARKQFEEKLKKEFESRDIEAVMSLDLFEPTFTAEKKSKQELRIVEQILATSYFDAILFTKIKGIENKIVYSETFKQKDYLDIKFKDDYYLNQEIFYNPEYYRKFNIYHAETSLYCICPIKERELIWKGYIDIVHPISIQETVNDYINLLVFVLEEENLLKKKDIE
ncbi:hypothetical protein ATE90_2479 [Polaribacter sp. Hel1_33_96]|uniref:hypothetical protein n=1 Tax=Polaribacter sp. Hel1_33_96 TaxID=1336805 RepID=UPI000C715468|nr:hypothetical protein [Polaribacter sp. Hel1_33_96]PKV66022.1 hypothetical protein ATE90_2479 [Polaribacter sp. Hel1_33_96]